MATLFSVTDFVRLRSWWYHNGIFLLGVVFSGISKVHFYQIIIGFIVSSLYLAHGYALNGYYDYAGYEDVVALRKNNIVLVIFPWLLLMCNIILSLFLLPEVLILILFGSVLSWMYSAPPFFIKKNPILRLVFNAVGFSLLFLIGVRLTGVWNKEALSMFSFFCILFIPIELIHDLNDAPEDVKFHIKTVPVLLGEKVTVFLVSLSLILLFSYALLLMLLGYAGLIFIILTFFFILSLIVLLSAHFLSKKYGFSKYSGIKAKARIIAGVYLIALLIIFIK